jgi:hypothetical protein
MTSWTDDSKPSAASYTDDTKPRGINFLGAYSATTTYAVNDGCSYGGANYVCILESLNHLPTDITYWEADKYTNDSL